MNIIAQHCAKLFSLNMLLEWLMGALAIAAIVAAIWLLVQQAYIEFRKLEAAIPKEPDPNRPMAQRAADFVEALPNLINALAKAPAPIVLITLGLLLVWLPVSEPGETCVKVIEAELPKPDQAG